MKERLNSRIPQLVALITKEIRSREDKKSKWARFKKDNDQELRALLELPDEADGRAGDLVGFYIHPDKNIILLNYTAQAHNVLHDVAGGWTTMVRLMRGLVYEFGSPGDASQVKLVSRGFEKFFNYNEMPETRVWSLLREAPEGELVVCREKADGHMIEYFIHDQELYSTTRGKMGTPSSEIALGMFGRGQFIKTAVIAKSKGFDLMNVVVELVHPNTEVHVDYDGEEQLYLLAAYDKRGDAAPLWLLNKIADKMLDDDEMERYLKHAGDDVRDFVTVMVQTGARPNELLAIRSRDVEEGRLIIRGGKTRSARRVIPLTADAEKILRRRLPDLFRENNYQQIRRMHIKALEDANLPDVSLYSFRHKFATELVSKGVPDSIAAKLLGHSNLQTIQKYVHPSQDDLENAIKTLQTDENS